MGKSFNPLAAELRSLQIEVSGLRAQEAELVEALTELAHAVSPKLRGGPFAIDWDTDALEPCFTTAMDKACKVLASKED